MESIESTAFCHEFTDALTEVLAESAFGPARRGRLQTAGVAPVVPLQSESATLGHRQLLHGVRAAVHALDGLDDVEQGDLRSGPAESVAAAPTGG